MVWVPKNGGRLGLAALVGVAGIGMATVAALAGPGRTGKFVRVERPRKAAAESLQTCVVTGHQVQKFTCFGFRPPQINDEYTLLGTEGVRGRVRVSRVSVGELDMCKIGLAHDAEFEYLTPPPTPRAGGRQYSAMAAVAVRGIPLGAGRARWIQDSSRLRAPSGGSEQIWMALDLTGDGSPDLLSTWHPGCDNASARPVVPASRTLRPVCLDYWRKDDAQWTLHRTDSYYLCL